MSEQDWDAFAADYEAQERFEKEMAEKQKAAAEAWRKEWPNACTACGGWGTSGTFYESHGLPGPKEALTDPCEALPAKTCHRCLADGLTLDGEGPCSNCGWNYDDGEPHT